MSIRLARRGTNSKRHGGALWSTTFANGFADLNAEVEDGNTAANDSYPGNSTLRMAMVVGTRDGHKTRTRFPAVAGAPTSLGIPAQSAVAYTYDVVVPSGTPLFQTSTGQDLKTPGVGGLPDAKGGWYTSAGGVWTTDSWSCRVQLRHPRSSWYGEAINHAFAQAYLYVHHAAGWFFTDQSRPNAEGAVDYGIVVTFRNQATGVPLEFLAGRNTISMRVVMNTTGNNNGRVQMWLNGVLGVDLADVRFVEADNVPCNQLMTEVFYNGNLPSGQGHDIDFIAPRLHDGTPSGPYTPSPAPTGLTGNQATFATGLANWNKTTNATAFTLEHSTADGGTMRWLTTTAASIGAGSSFNSGADRVAVTPGQSITGSIEAKQVAGTFKPCRVRIEFYTSADVALTLADDVAWNVTLSGGFQTIAKSMTVPATAAWCRLQPYVQGAAVNDDFRFDNAYLQPAGPATAPTGITNVVGWYDASDASSFTLAGSAVAEWRDKSASGRHLTQSTTSLRPARSGTLNGLSTVVFDGGDVLTRLSTSQFRNSPGGAVFIVVKGTYTGTAGRTLFATTANSDTAVRAALTVNASGLFNYAGRRLDADSFQGFNFGGVTPVNDTAYVFGATWDWANAQIRGHVGTANQGPAVFQTAGSTSDTPSNIYMGGPSSGIGGFVGQIAEVLVIGAAPDATQRAAIVDYLAARWAV